MCPLLVRLVLLALAAPPVLIRHLSALCPPCVLLVSALCPPCVALCPLWPRLQTLSGMSPPCVQLASPCVCFGRASKPCPACVRLVSAWPAPRSLVRLASALCLSALCSLRLPVRPCVRLALYPACVGFGRASKRCVCHVALCVRHLSAPVFFLSSRCPLVFRSLSALCRFLAASMVWLWPGLCQLCARSLVFAPLFVLCPLLSTLVEVFVAGPLPAVRLATFSRQCSCLP